MYHPQSLNNQILFNSEAYRVHEYASRLASKPRAELFCSCKRRKFVGQNEVKIVSFQLNKIGYPI